MIYLTGQLLLFLLVSAFLGFLVGWFSRGALVEAARIPHPYAPVRLDWPYPAPHRPAETGPETDEAWYLASDTNRP